MPTSKGDRMDYIMWKIKFLAYLIFMCLMQCWRKAQTFPRKKNMSDLSFLDPNNAIDKTKIELKHQNNMAMAYIAMALKMNVAQRSNSRYQIYVGDS